MCRLQPPDAPCTSPDYVSSHPLSDFLMRNHFALSPGFKTFLDFLPYIDGVLDNLKRRVFRKLSKKIMDLFLGRL